MKNWRTFDNFPEQSICVMCGTNENKSCVLIVKAYGKHEGMNMEATPVHVDCLHPDKMVFDGVSQIVYLKCE